MLDGVEFIDEVTEFLDKFASVMNFINMVGKFMNFYFIRLPNLLIAKVRNSGVKLLDVYL